MTMIKHYTVEADYNTGEWLGEAVDTGEMVDQIVHLAKQDTDEASFSTYEAPIINEAGCHMGDTETRAVTVIWVLDSESD